ncbi:hypothetical protein PUN28_019048 [Cardiocondyla obscurior]|uniref:Uncharacterized protein n=1 Tax=Cardiocondyla obscurior TaxID=286306 RepID=A0AAW2EFW1_9HYME
MARHVATERRRLRKHHASAEQPKASQIEYCNVTMAEVFSLIRSNISRALEDISMNRSGRSKWHSVRRMRVSTMRDRGIVS